VGLALGGLLAGALVEFGPAPLRLVYAFLLVAFILCGIGILAIPETVTDRTRPRLHLRVAVPPALRPAFVSGLPALVAPWALGGLWLSLGPSLLLSMTASTNRLIAGLLIFLLCMSGALASFAVRRQPAHASMVLGCFALAAGVLTTGIAVALANPVVFLLGTAAAEQEFGIAFLGAFRTLAALADPLSRGAVMLRHLPRCLPGLLDPGPDGRHLRHHDRPAPHCHRLRPRAHCHRRRRHSHGPPRTCPRRSVSTTAEPRASRLAA
jgi:MFS family permease